MSGLLAPVDEIEAHLGVLGDQVAAVMRPLIAPLREKWEWVTGDDEQVHETARRWRAMSQALTRVAQDEAAAAARVVGEWEGLAHDAFDEAVVQVVRDLDEVAERTSEVADLLDEAAVAVRDAERVVGELVRELIEWAAVSLVVSAAGAIVTLGASAAAGAAAAAAKAGIVGAKIATELSRLATELRRIQLALGVFECWVTTLTFAQRRLVIGIEKGLVKGLSGVDAAWAHPTIDLAHIIVDPGRPFEEAPTPAVR